MEDININNIESSGQEPPKKDPVPHFEGKKCPEWGWCSLRFWKFQNGKNGQLDEVYNCDSCGPVVMHLDWNYGY